jgi:hypothetical protein
MTNKNVQSTIRMNLMLEKQSHSFQADVHCLGGFGESASILAYSGHHDGNRKWQALMLPLYCVGLTIHSLVIGSSLQWFRERSLQENPLTCDWHKKRLGPDQHRSAVGLLFDYHV